MHFMYRYSCYIYSLLPNFAINNSLNDICGHKEGDVISVHYSLIVDSSFGSKFLNS